LAASCGFIPVLGTLLKRGAVVGLLGDFLAFFVMVLCVYRFG
jgi:hypothetical protein